MSSSSVGWNRNPGGSAVHGVDGGGTPPTRRPPEDDDAADAARPRSIVITIVYLSVHDHVRTHLLVASYRIEPYGWDLCLDAI